MNTGAIVQLKGELHVLVTALLPEPTLNSGISRIPNNSSDTPKSPYYSNEAHFLFSTFASFIGGASALLTNVIWSSLAFS